HAAAILVESGIPRRVAPVVEASNRRSDPGNPSNLRLWIEDSRGQAPASLPGWRKTDPAVSEVSRASPEHSVFAPERCPGMDRAGSHARGYPTSTCPQQSPGETLRFGDKRSGRLAFLCKYFQHVAPPGNPTLRSARSEFRSRS